MSARLEYQRKWQKNQREKNPDVIKGYKLKESFGISIEEYNQMLFKHDNKCAICSKPEIAKFKGKIKALAVDHCHETGKIRGLLCSGCNTALGKFKDSIELLIKAANYLKAQEI